MVRLLLIVSLAVKTIVAFLLKVIVSFSAATWIDSPKVRVVNTTTSSRDKFYYERVVVVLSENDSYFRSNYFYGIDKFFALTIM